MDISLREWVADSYAKVGDEMLWKNSAGRQVMFVRDVLAWRVAQAVYEEDQDEAIRVISTHRSKSIDLPVYKLSNKKLGITFIMRNNFYDWKLSVISERPIIADFGDLFYTTPPIEPKYTGDHLAPVYFEGFPEEFIFGYYQSDNKRRRWSAEVGTDYELWTVIYLCLKSLGAIKPLLWHTRESHVKQLKEESNKFMERMAKWKLKKNTSSAP